MRSIFVTTLAVCVAGLAFAQPVRKEAATIDPDYSRIKLELLSTYKSGVYNGGAAEIVAYDKDSKKLFVVNAFANTLDVLDLNNPVFPSLLTTISFNSFGAGVNSVAVYNGLVAVAVEATVKQDLGTVVFISATDYSVLKTVTVGSLPDMVTFNEDGTKVLAANEGEPSNDYTNDPEGSISIIDLSSGVTNATALTVGFTDFNFGGSRRNEIDTTQVRVFGLNASVAQDLEPEYITIKGDSAWFTLQEQNAIAKIRLSTGVIEWIKPLGFKDHSLPGNGIDASDRDINTPATGSSGKINIQNWPVFGMYQPDGVASFTSNGTTFLVTANEGEARGYAGFNEEIRAGASGFVPDAVLWPTWAAEYKPNQFLGRLNVTKALGDTDGDGDMDSIYSYGARSFSIWNAETGELVYDSGDDFEQYFAANLPGNFNYSHDDKTLDSRSDNKGPEPEGVVLGSVGDSLYAFFGLERVGGIMVYNITDPVNPVFVQYINNRDYSVTPGEATVNTVGDLGPEGLCWISAADSPNGRNLLIVGNEISGTTTIYQVTGSVENFSQPVSANGNFIISGLGVDSISFYGVTTPGTVKITRVDGAPESVSYDGVLTQPSLLASYRIVLEAQSGLLFDSAYVTFDLSMIPGAGVVNSSNIRIFKRETPGSGSFTELEIESVTGTKIRVKVYSFSEFVFGSDEETLPVELAGLSARELNGTLLINWSTLTETNNAGFNIQGRVNAQSSWKTLGFVAGHGTTLEIKQYQFSVKNADFQFIRLMQTDLDGTSNVHAAIEVSGERPTEFSVDQNYPNPFNPETTIRFALPFNSDVQILISDLLGRQVGSISGSFEAGKNSVSVSARTFASGVYYYTVKAGTYSVTRKMVVLK